MLQNLSAPREVLQNLPPDLRVVFYDMNGTRCLSVNEARTSSGSSSTDLKSPLKAKAMNEWIKTCKDDICNAIKDVYVGVIVVVGIGEYGVGLDKQ